jgi:hypothetical protein
VGCELGQMEYPEVKGTVGAGRWKSVLDGVLDEDVLDPSETPVLDEFLDEKVLVSVLDTVLDDLPVVRLRWCLRRGCSGSSRRARADGNVRSRAGLEQRSLRRGLGPRPHNSKHLAAESLHHLHRPLPNSPFGDSIDVESSVPP